MTRPFDGAGHRPAPRRLRGVTTAMSLLLASALAVGGASPALAAEDRAPEPAALAFASTPSADDGSRPGGDARAEDPQISMEVSETSEWAMKREGLTVLSWGFAPEADVAIAIDDTVVGEDTADENGDLNFTFTVELAPGEHTITLTSDGGSASHPFTVIADEEFYDEEYAANFDPAIETSRWVVSESELADEPLRVTGSGFPNSSNPVGPTTVDVVVDGEAVETIRTDIVGAVATELAGPLSVGAHEIALVSPIGEASRTVEVVPDGQGDLPAAGVYEGTSVQTHADGVELDDRDERPIAFEIDADGRIAGLQGEYWWFCAGGSGFKDFADSGFPATPITVDRPFEIRWHDYILYGTVHSDGTASGTAWDGMGECGSSILEWSTALDGEPPLPGYDPEASVSPSELTESELADTGVTVVGTGFAPESEITLTVGGDEAATAATDDDGDVSFTYTSGSLGAGTHTARLTSGDLSAEASFTVTGDGNPAPGTIPPTAPVESDLDPALEDAISAPAEAEAGESITVVIDGVEPGSEVGVWLFSDAVYLGTRTVDEDGEVVVTIPAGTEPGEHKLAVWEAPDTQVGWTGIRIVADDDELPDTGAWDPMLAVALGALLLVAGPALVLRARRSVA